MFCLNYKARFANENGFRESEFQATSGPSLKPFFLKSITHHQEGVYLCVFD